MDMLFNLTHNKLVSSQNKFETVGTITAQGSTLAVTGREWSSVKTYFDTVSATYLAYNVSKDAYGMEFRFQTSADADSHVVEVWGACNEDHLTLLATLTLTGGTQRGDLITGSTYFVFVDTIVASTENLFNSGKAMDSAANRICRYAVDLCGYNKILFIATTLASSTSLKVQAKSITG